MIWNEEEPTEHQLTLELLCKEFNDTVSLNDILLKHQDISIEQVRDAINLLSDKLNGNKNRMATYLGISRPKLYRTMVLLEPKFDLYYVPTYDDIIEWCEDNPKRPFAESMVHNCEGNSRKHWRSIVKTTLDIQRMMRGDKI